MEKLAREAQPAVEELIDLEEEALFAEIGLRSKAIEADPKNSKEFLLPEASKSFFIESEALQTLGKRIFKRLNREAYGLICGQDAEGEEDRKKVVTALGLGEVSAAAVLSSVLVTSFGLSPAIGVVIAAILIKRAFKPTAEEFCTYWREQLDQEQV